MAIKWDLYYELEMQTVALDLCSNILFYSMALFFSFYLEMLAFSMSSDRRFLTQII